MNGVKIKLLLHILNFGKGYMKNVVTLCLKTFHYYFYLFCIYYSRDLLSCFQELRVLGLCFQPLLWCHQYKSLLLLLPRWPGLMPPYRHHTTKRKLHYLIFISISCLEVEFVFRCTVLTDFVPIADNLMYSVLWIMQISSG